LEWDPLDKLAVTLKNHRQIDFMLSNLKRYLAKKKEQSKTVPVLDALLLTSVIYPQTKFAKFAIFGITSGFISFSIFV
jgi:hypothetical protein